jgi:hypothetical protein
MATVYQKTFKGVAEIETRANRLPPRLRNALILVDGRRSDDELRQLLGPNSDDTLHALAEQGYVEGAVPQVRPSAPSPAASAPTPTPTPKAQTAPVREPGFEATRREAVRVLTDMVGPMAESLALRMERAPSPAELRPLLEVGHQIIRNTRGAALAANFRSQFIDPAP